MTEISNSTAALELSVQGNARSVFWPEVKIFLSWKTMHLPNVCLLAKVFS